MKFLAIFALLSSQAQAAPLLTFECSLRDQPETRALVRVSESEFERFREVVPAEVEISVDGQALEISRGVLGQRTIRDNNFFLTVSLGTKGSMRLGSQFPGSDPSLNFKLEGLRLDRSLDDRADCRLQRESF